MYVMMMMTARETQEQKNAVVVWSLSLSLGKYATTCRASLVYSYDITQQSRTCRCLSQADPTCHLTFSSVDGCTCAEGLYLDDTGKCVTADGCPCYDKDSVVLPGKVINKDGVVWYG